MPKFVPCEVFLGFPCSLNDPSSAQHGKKTKSLLGGCVSHLIKKARMDIVVTIAEDGAPTTLKKVITAIRAQDFQVKHDHKNWGDWLRIEGCETVISIECVDGYTSSATIEHCEEDSEALLPALFKAFDRLGWVGMDEDGPYPLV
jgi:hypothetical protein